MVLERSNGFRWFLNSSELFIMGGDVSGQYSTAQIECRTPKNFLPMALDEATECTVPVVKENSIDYLENKQQPS